MDDSLFTDYIEHRSDKAAKSPVSSFFYIHQDMAKNPNWNKIGIGLTPHSVVRARQKYTSEPFYINHLYFGEFSDINFLELNFKQKFYNKSAKIVLGTSATELYNMTEHDIIFETTKIITYFDLKIKKINLKTPYSSSNSKNCMLGIPNEDHAYLYLKNLIENNFDTAFEYEQLNNNTRPMYKEFFYE